MEANETASFEQLYKYPFPDRTLVNSREWESLCRKAKVDKLTGISVTDGRYNGYNNDVFTIRPYYWDNDPKLEDLPNFFYKPTRLAIIWYKYAFRGAYMNQNLTADMSRIRLGGKSNQNRTYRASDNG